MEYILGLPSYHCVLGGVSFFLATDTVNIACDVGPPRKPLVYLPSHKVRQRQGPTLRQTYNYE